MRAVAIDRRSITAHHHRVDAEDVVNEVMGGGLRALNKVAGSSVLERFGVEKQAQQLVYKGVKRAFETATRAAKRFATSQADGSKKPPRLFDLNLTEEQQLMRDTLQRFAEEAMRPAARDADTIDGPSSGLLSDFAELGAVALAISESDGGAVDAPSCVSNMLIAEDLAYGDMGLAYVALSPLSFVHAVAAAGTDAQKKKYLAPYVAGELPPAAVAWVEGQAGFDPGALRMVAKRRGGGFELTGEKSLVALAADAHVFLVAANVGRGGPRLFIVDRGAPGLTVTPEPAMGLRSAALGTVRLKRVRVPAEAMLGGDEWTSDDYWSLVYRSRVGWGAMAVGTAQAVLDYVIPYCNERIAFGEPISHRQAVAFLIADIAIELESMRMLVYRAGARLDHGLECERESYLAQVLCAEKAMYIGTSGVQLLGGAGFIKEHPMEIWYRALRAVGVMQGNVLV